MKDADLFGAIATASVSKMADFKPQELTSTAWAFKHVEITDVPLTRMIRGKVLKHEKRARPFDVDITINEWESAHRCRAAAAA
jgi:hypothetical protein